VKIENLKNKKTIILIKILFSTTSFDTIDNGPALFANLVYTNLLDSKDFDLRILTEDIIGNEKEQIINLDLQQSKYNIFFYQFIRVYRYHRQAIKIRKKFKFDIIVYNNAFTAFLSVIFLKVPVIVMINDYERLILKNENFSFKKSYFKNIVLSFLEKTAAKNSKIVIVNSEFMKIKISKAYNIESSKLNILIKGIDLSKYKFRLREKMSNNIQVLFVKADYKRGRLINVVNAIKSISRYNIKLVVIGPPKHELNNVREILDLSGISYELNGPMRPEKVRNYFNTCDIFCLPPIKEALGVANMEALASGLPVITSNVGGIPEVLDNGKCGWIIEPENSHQLKHALMECIENDKMRIAKSLYGKEFVTKFNSNDLIKNFTEILKMGNRI
jgi:colanic acid/amylovoran biosynthesis glycosyltransferase